MKELGARLPHVPGILIDELIEVVLQQEGVLQFALAMEDSERNATVRVHDRHALYAVQFLRKRPCPLPSLRTITHIDKGAVRPDPLVKAFPADLHLFS